MYTARGKNSTKKCNRLDCSDQRDTIFKENPDGKWNKVSSYLRARLHPAKLPTCEKESNKR